MDTEIKFNIGGLIRCPECKHVWWVLGKNRFVAPQYHGITLGEFYSRVYGFNRSANNESGNHAVNCPSCGLHLIVEPILQEPCLSCGQVWGYYHFEWFRDKFWERLSYCPCYDLCIIRNPKGEVVGFSDELVHKHSNRRIDADGVPRFDTDVELGEYRIKLSKDGTMLDEQDPSLTEHLISCPAGIQ